MSRSQRFARNQKKAWTAFAWFGTFFLFAQAALALALESWRSDWRDPEFARKLQLLQVRLAEHPDRPLVLMLGSSRTLQGFRPERFEGMTAPDGGPVLAFNFGLTGVGPMKELACLRRLRDADVRPSLLLVEVMPALLNEPGWMRISEEKWLNAATLSAEEVAELRRYHSARDWLFTAWVRARLAPGYEYRLPVLKSLAAQWVPPEAGPTPLGRMDRYGWQPFGRDFVTAEERLKLLYQVHFQYCYGTREFRIGAGPRQALCDLLELCRQEGIPAMLVLMPEGDQFRDWYSEGMKTQLPRFLAELQQRFGVAVIDARTWFGDDYFWDSHHLMPRGAVQFTDRLRQAIASEWSARRPARSASEGSRRPRWRVGLAKE